MPLALSMDNNALPRLSELLIIPVISCPDRIMCAAAPTQLVASNLDTSVYLAASCPRVMVLVCLRRRVM